MRKPPSGSPPPVTPRTGDRVTQTLEYKLITPMFGGGVQPQQADPVTTIRTQSIIGQLRFWWRACRVLGFDSPQAMRKRELEIWGSTDKPSAVSLAVMVTNPGSDLTGIWIKFNTNYGIPGYAAFPLQPPNGRNQVRQGIEFTLRVSFPERFCADVEAALWAWETFGGIGARTRRGFGSLQRTKKDGQATAAPGDINKLRTHLVDGLNRHVASGRTSTGVMTPHLPKQLPQTADTNPLRLLARGSALEAWRHSIDRYRAFRQARTPSTPRPGRSYWPEPDAIRKASRTFNKHQPFRWSVDYFPRALFGLPIVFHFQGGAGDPERDVLLVGEQGAKKDDRMASRLILKAVPLQNGAAAMAFVLSGPRLPRNSTRAMLTGAVNQVVTAIPPDNVTFPSAGAPADRDPLKTKSDGRTPWPMADVINAFLSTFEK